MCRFRSRAKEGNTGNGSPIVWANRIFITVGAADGTRRGKVDTMATIYERVG